MRSKTEVLFSALTSARERLLRPREDDTKSVFEEIELAPHSEPKYEEEDDEKYALKEQTQKNIHLEPQQQDSKPNYKHIVNEDYDIWDLTYTFIVVRVSVVVIAFLFTLLLSIRYYSLGCLLYVVVESHAHQWKWIIVVMVSRFLYFVLVMKVSLKTAETRTETVLKTHWNSKQSDVSEIFQVTDGKKLCISIIRGIIPAELAFLYICGHNKTRNFQIYAAINYIYAGIQCILYYPFFMIYVTFIDEDDDFALNKYFKYANLLIACGAIVLVLVLSLVLLLIGVRKKYGKVFFCC